MSAWKPILKGIAGVVAIGALGVSSSSNGQPTLPPDKQVIEDRYLQERAAGAQNPAPKDPNAPYPAGTDAPPDKGIIDDPDGPFSSQEIRISNRWQGVINGIETTVYAGVESPDDDADQGIIITLSDFPTGVGKRTVLTPVRTGRVHIIAEQNSQLILAADDGSYLFVFDVGTAAFTSSTSNPIRGDLNGDGVVDIRDVTIVQAVLNTPAFGSLDPRDLNHDGKIDALDIRILTTLCTLARCASH